MRNSRQLVCHMVLIGCLCAAGCRVGPKYTKPAVPQTPTGFKELGEDDTWKAAHPSDAELRGNWWELFQDPQLTELETMVNVSNQTLQQAAAQFRQARALVALNRAGYFPTIASSPGITASQFARTGQGLGTTIPGVPAGGGQIIPTSTGTNTRFSLPFTVSWEPDLFGRIGLTVQGAVASAQATAADLESLRLSIHADLAVNYFSLHATDMEMNILRNTIEAFERTLQLTINRYNGGVASRADVEQARAQLETTRAALTDLQITRSQLEHAIAALTGRAPANLSIPVAEIQGTPPPIPVALPSKLLERRPDVASAERQVAAANANVGLAEVAYFPSLALSLSGGFQSTDVTSWLNWPSRFWSVGPALSQTLFDFGRRRAQTLQFTAAYDATVASYRQTALTAFQEVEDSLVALHQLSIEAEQQAAAVRSARESLNLETERYKAGTVSYLDIIIAQTTLLNAERSAAQILGRRMSAAVNLIRALGGGWDASSLPSATDLGTVPGQLGKPVKR